MLISHVSEHVRYKDRVVGLHFFNPVVIIKLVEVIKGSETSETVMQAAYDLCVKMDKRPIRVEKDSPSFIINRVNGPNRLYLGAVVDEGIAEPEEIDALIRYHGSPIGHFELADHIGLDVIYDALQYRRKIIHPDYSPYQKLVEKVQLKEFGKKTGQGFYDWSHGRLTIDQNKRTDKIMIEDLDYIKFNEAIKLVEEGVSTAADIDLAMRLVGEKAGPIETAKKFNKEQVVARLTILAKRFGLEVLKPANILSETDKYDAVFSDN